MSDTYAVIQLNGKQFLVEEGETLTLDRLAGEANDTLTFTDVLLLVKNGTATIGTPLIPKAKVTAKLLSHEKDDTIRVFHYKSKSRYRKTRGHRQPTSTISITAIAG